MTAKGDRARLDVELTTDYLIALMPLRGQGS
jgi:hypothetical protein